MIVVLVKNSEKQCVTFVKQVYKSANLVTAYSIALMGLMKDNDYEREIAKQLVHLFRIKSRCLNSKGEQHI